ncbi:MAG: VWA domain-containing protein [Ilumatobacteraceae bacterium]
MRELPYQPDRGDLDVDASLDAIVEGRAGGLIDAERLRVRGWVRPGTALCLLVDRSGSMGGKPLATAAIAAAAVSSRGAADYSVLAFGKDVVVTKAQDAEKGADRVVGDLLALRGFGTTDVAGALRVAAAQLGRSRAARKVVVLLSDCRATVEGDPVAAATALDELVVIAPDEDADEAQAFATQVGAAFTTVAGPSDVPGAIARVLSA